MSSREETNFVRLLMFSVDLSADVIRAFTESKILCNYENSFTHFLDAHKHDLFHSWIPNTHCCQCSSVTMGTALTKKMAEIDEAIFNKMFDKSGSTNLGHFKKGIHGSVTQHCLCRITPRLGLRLEDVDVSLLCSIIFTCVKLHKQDLDRMRSIRQQRWNVFRAAITRRYSDEDFTMVWNNLEKAVIGIVQEHFIPSYGRIVEHQIKLMKIADVAKVDMNDLLEKLSKDKKIGQVLTTRMNGITNALRDETMLRQSESQYNREQHIELELDRLEDKENSQRQFFSEKVNHIRFDVDHTALRCPVVIEGRKHFHFKLETPSSWDNGRMVASLEKVIPTWNEDDNDFQILSARIGSLVIKTTANLDMMKDRETFQNAVKSFLKKLVEVCEIDTSVPVTVPVEINISGTPFTDNEGSAATSAGAVDEASGSISVQLNSAMPSQECLHCKDKDDIIERLKRELSEKNAYIAELENKLTKKSDETGKSDIIMSSTNQ
ncbi:uncharacterized protein LOC134708656 [Mytilus trossulus]|uniref:uncharacterized protein LOC134708656 n=1 Tax=Mytilus trossulus TaxID=6551 RepID=UPI003003DC2F